MQRHYFSKKGPSGQRSDFSTSHVWMWELDHKEIWALKNWCFWAVVLEKTLESPLDCKEIQPVHPKGNQSWIFIDCLSALDMYMDCMQEMIPEGWFPTAIPTSLCQQVAIHSRGHALSPWRTSRLYLTFFSDLSQPGSRYHGLPQTMVAAVVF